MNNNTLISQNLNPTEAAFAGGFAGGVFAGFMIIVVVLCILQMIAWWKIFVKAGEEGWKAIVPFYNLYIFYKIVGMKNWFWCFICLNVIAAFVAEITNFNTLDYSKNTFTGANLFGAIVYFLTLVAGAVIQIVQSVRLSKAFDRSVIFTLGLVFLEPIFILVLAFDSSKYNKKVVKAWM